jgi:hypothetical protein
MDRPDSPPQIDAIAQAFQDAANIDRALVVAKEPAWPSSSHFHIPYVGWIGENYCGGTVVVAKNPGGLNVNPSEVDGALDDELSRLAAATDPVVAMRRISALFRQQQRIGMHKILVQVMTRLEEDLGSIAYLNPCPYRVQRKNNLGEVNFRAALRLVAAPLLKALKPDTIVYLNSIEEVVAPLERKSVLPRPGRPGQAPWRYVLGRKRPDSRGLSDRGLAALELAARDNNMRKSHRQRSSV